MPTENHYNGAPVGSVVATAAAPTLTEGRLVKLSCDLSGNLRVSGGGGGGGAVTIADGADITQGAIADLAVSTDASGTVNAHLRGIVKLLAAGLATTPSVSTTATAPSQTTVGTTAASALSAVARKGLMIQNQGTTVIKVLLGSATPTQSNYTVALPACGSANDGSSPAWYGPPGVIWQGAVQWISDAAGGLATAVELT